MEIDNIYYATGKRKRAVARTWLTPGKGEITVNNMPIDDYFSTDTTKAILTQPLVYTSEP